MKNKNYRWTIIGIIILVVLLIDMIIYHIKGPTIVRSTTSVPKPDPGREAFYFNFHTKKWVYRGEIDSNRAKGINKPSEATDEMDIQEYLEEHIDGYKEDTYWGEEYEFNNIDDE